jgi:exodeoxyribonuclease V beta subunit
VPRLFRGSLARTAFITSFTGLTAGTGREEVERDQPVEQEPIAGPVIAPVRNEGPVHGIHLFEKGARAGDFFHEVLEHLDFRNPVELETLVPETLAMHGFGHTPHEGALKEKLREVLEIELEPGLRLGQVAREDRLSEVDFACRLPSLRPEDLRHLFAERRVPTLEEAELGRLRFSPVTGFLRGAIDLFFRHGDRYYLLDWKSNWLGNAPEDYDAPGVEAAMRSHHYALQAHLYVLAADRYLQARLPGYDYERHFGGVFYLFLRGVERGNPDRGIYRIRPDLELVEAMRKLAEGGV